MNAHIHKILLVGATGYVGGTILDHLIKCPEPCIRNLTFDLLVRGKDQAKRLRDAFGARVNPILWEGLSATAFTADTAANYQVVVNTGFGFNPAGARAFVEGLARRVKPGAPAPWLLHISGCTNLADRPLTQEAHPEREWDDVDGGAIFEYLRDEDERDPYLQRTTEVGVLTTAEEMGVNAVTLSCPCIFGTGTGLFNQQAVIIPIIMRFVVTHGYGFKLNDTSNFDWVHVEDLADAYVLLLRAILERPDRGVDYIPSGKKGILFPAVGRVLQSEIMQGCLDAAFAAGVLPRDDTPKDKEIRPITLEEIAPEGAAGFLDMAERTWAGHKAQKGTMLKKLVNWSPTKLEEAWKQEFVTELNALREGKRGVRDGELRRSKDTSV